MTTPTTARDMIEMLRRHYLPKPEQPAAIFAPEIAAPGSNRRADLIVQGVTAAAGWGLIGHQVKVSRADVLAELADLTKSDPWQRYCNRWYLVIPDLGLIDGLELPDTWGVLLPPSGRRTRSMTVHRPAPKLQPVEQAPALRTLAAWLHWKLRDARTDVRQAQAEAERQRGRADEAERRAGPRESVYTSRERDTVTEIVRKLGTSGLGSRKDGRILGHFGESITVDDVVAALRGLGRVRDRAAAAQREAEALASTTERLAAGARGMNKIVADVRAAVAGIPTGVDDTAAAS